MTAPSRKRTFERSEPTHKLTPQSVGRLSWFGECTFLHTFQYAKLNAMTDTAAAKHLRTLFDLGLLDRTAVSPEALTEPGTLRKIERIYGRSPTIHWLTKAGKKVLIEAGYYKKEELQEPPRIATLSDNQLVHDLRIRDMRVWLEVHQQQHTHWGDIVWKDGKRAAAQTFKPDAWFIYPLRQPMALVGMLEVDMGTERSKENWEGKFHHYRNALLSGEITSITSTQSARVIVITSTVARREALYYMLGELLMAHETPGYRFWLADKTVLNEASLTDAVWRVPGIEELQSLVHNRFI